MRRLMLLLLIATMLLAACGPEPDSLPEPDSEDCQPDRQWCNDEICTVLSAKFGLIRCIDKEAGVVCWRSDGLVCLPLDKTNIEGWKE